MIRSTLIGLTAGARAMTPLAAVSNAARRGALAPDSGAPSWLGLPAVAVVSKLLAAGEMWGDKKDAAPDRIGAAGLVARLLSGGLAGAALAPRRRVVTGALLGAGAAAAATYLTFHARKRAGQRFGGTSAGLMEDALTLSAAQIVVSGIRQKP